MMYPKWPDTDAAGNSMRDGIPINDLVFRPAHRAFRISAEEELKQKIRDMLYNEYGLKPKEPTK